ncbi:MAG: carbonic anhydrase family protein [Planctomycetota bacterium]
MTFTYDAKSQAQTTPRKALDELLEGNRRFQSGTTETRDLRRQIAATREGQWPIAAILSCIDSRVSAELVFDAGIGTVFSARVAGNFVNDDLLGSLEYGCKVAGAPLLMVLGHTACGAIKGACDGVELGHVTGLLQKLRPAVDAVTEPADPAQRTSENRAFVDAVVRRNVERTVAAIREQSSVLSELEASGAIQIVGAVYDLETGAVELT